MPEETKPTVDPEGSAAVDPSKKEDAGTVTIKELSERMQVLEKQNLDKDSFIKTVTGENRELRGKLEGLTHVLQGKSERQKDAILDKVRDEYIADGYSEKDVDKLLNLVSTVANKIASEKIAPIITDTVEELIETDSKIDQKLVKEHQEEIWNEYKRFIPESTPRKIKVNFKKAYDAVVDRLAAKAKAEAGPTDAEREAAIRNAGSPGAGGRPQTADEEKKFLDGIENAGPVRNSRFT